MYTLRQQSQTHNKQQFSHTQQQDNTSNRTNHNSNHRLHLPSTVHRPFWLWRMLHSRWNSPLSKKEGTEEQFSIILKKSQHSQCIKRMQTGHDWNIEQSNVTCIVRPQSKVVPTRWGKVGYMAVPGDWETSNHSQVSKHNKKYFIKYNWSCNDDCSRYRRACNFHMLIGTLLNDATTHMQHQHVLRTVGDFLFADHPDTYGGAELCIGFFQHSPCYCAEGRETTSQ